jgi:uridine phosphorylase
MNRHAKELHAPAKPPLVAGATPLIERRDHVAPSVFRPESLLREARRQKGLEPGSVPPVCVLDPDGDIVAHVRRRHAAEPCPQWACYHSTMWTWGRGDLACGIVGHVVGGSFAVLAAEQLFASGCELLVSVTSAGQITNVGPPPYYILVERALRDEGTSYHYLPPSNYVAADPALVALAAAALGHAGCPVHIGDSWTTDAPFRETAEVIASRRHAGILAVEMEAASLLAFARARARPVICLAHVSNQLGCVDGDFEKGDHNGAAGSLALVAALAAAWREMGSKVSGAPALPLPL